MIQFQDATTTVFQSALYQTTSTVLQTDDLVLVVDPTWLKHEVEAIRDYVAQVRGGRPLYLLFTHGDWDHILGFNAFPEAITIGSLGMKEHPNKQQKVAAIEEFDSKNYIARDYAIEWPRLDIVIDHDRQQLTVGGTTLTFYHANGHTHDGLFTVVEQAGILIAGDYLSNVEFPYIYHSSIDYEETMHKAARILDEHDIRLLIPGHGQVTQDRADMHERTRQSLLFVQALREAIREGDSAKIDALPHAYPYAPFVKGTQEFHRDNVALIQKELGISTR